MNKHQTSRHLCSGREVSLSHPTVAFFGLSGLDAGRIFLGHLLLGLLRIHTSSVSSVKESAKCLQKRSEVSAKPSDNLSLYSKYEQVQV